MRREPFGVLPLLLMEVVLVLLLVVVVLLLLRRVACHANRELTVDQARLPAETMEADADTGLDTPVNADVRIGGATVAEGRAGCVNRLLRGRPLAPATLVKADADADAPALGCPCPPTMRRGCMTRVCVTGSVGLESSALSVAGAAGRGAPTLLGW
jgi:hypothetical protein